MPSAERYAARVAAETGHACAECGRRGGRHHYGCRTNMRAIANRPKTCWQAKTMPYGVNPVWLAWIKAPSGKRLGEMHVTAASGIDSGTVQG